jgi:hypothetical protein
MPTLDPKLREQLASVIGKENQEGGARVLAEAGSRASIEALAVHLPAPYAHLDAAGRQLRNRLRARARQLGDVRHSDGRHEIVRLVEQTAYEHWHRMLFARFLAENDLLIHPEMKVAVTLGECVELALSEGAEDGWELAGRYASRMLPQIFRPEDPVLAVNLAAEHQHALEGLLASLPAELFRASDSLGWCYQFWQARKKKQINASEVKIGADELPAVTQLFTEPYMVQFLLHNTLGAWWVGAGRKLPLEMPYLRFLDDGTPAAGIFEGWPKKACELKVLDPCCGSGHFLVAAFEILVAFRMAEEGLSARDACNAVLRGNLFGLEIDARCVQIAAFALAMAAWTFPDAGGYRPLAAMNVACSGLAPRAKKEEWVGLAGDDERLQAGMGRMWELFQDAPVLGSLIDPTRDPPDPMFVAGFDEVQHIVTAALNKERGLLDPDREEETIAALGIIAAAETLGRSFHLVCTNVPYLVRSKQGETLRSFLSAWHGDTDTDLATAFLERISRFLSPSGTHATVTPQNWLHLGSYKTFRERLLRTETISMFARIGSGATATASWDVLRALLISSRVAPDPAARLYGVDAHIPDEAGRDHDVKNGPLGTSRQAELRRTGHRRIVVGIELSGRVLADYAKSFQGIKTGDDGRLRRFFWEVHVIGPRWRKLLGTTSETCLFGGMENIVDWLDDGALVARRQGVAAWGRAGVAASQMRSLPCSLYNGNLFDSNVSAIVPKDPKLVPALWTFCSSTCFNAEVRKIDSKLGVANSSLTSVPFDAETWRTAAASDYPGGLPAPGSTSPTQWVFAGYPRPSDAPLQVAVARLLGYRWPDQQPDELDSLADNDGVICIPAMRGERPAADRLADLIAAAWGQEWHPQVLTDLLVAVGHKGTLDEWLRDSFFRQHCELFHHRPFIWHIWDGHREGFSALVNYHKLDNETLKSLTYSYLGDWIRTQEIEAKAGTSGAGDKAAKAKALQQRLAAILEGEDPLDVFVRWKPIEEQPLGWNPDLDDGVRLNIRPFLTVADVGLKGAGVLRWKPNIKWGKDRGKNPPGSPWGEVRDNDTHLTLAEKRVARGE